MNFVERFGRSAMNRITSANPEATHGARIGGLVRLAIQYAKFGAVGLSATAVHVLAFTLLIEVAGFAPLLANLAAFGVAVLVSFVGHFYWTFRPDGGDAQRSHTAGGSLGRFIIVALTGLLLNSAAVFVVVNVLGLPYAYAIAVMVFAIPPIVFVLNRLWAFA